ncbi:MAG: hypothetical protein WCR36_06470 [Bacteroidaceae bacterium]
MNRIACTHYNDADEKVILKASSLGMPLIGGTALEVLADYYHVPCIRKRSENDLDFSSTSEVAIKNFKSWVVANTDPDKVKVDIYSIPHLKIPFELKLNIKGVLVMSPIYLIWSKLQRANDKDIKDIIWLLTLVTPEDLEEWLSRLGVTDGEIELINDIISGEYD